MSVPVWDVGLPQVLLVDGASGTLPDVILRTPMDAGPAKQRRRFTAGPEPFKGHIKVTDAQFATFSTFYNTTLLGGSLRFSWTHPKTDAACEMRFTAAPTWSVIEPDCTRIEMSLEVLP